MSAPVGRYPRNTRRLKRFRACEVFGRHSNFRQQCACASPLPDPPKRWPRHALAVQSTGSAQADPATGVSECRREQGRSAPRRSARLRRLVQAGAKLVRHRPAAAIPGLRRAGRAREARVLGAPLAGAEERLLRADLPRAAAHHAGLDDARRAPLHRGARAPLWSFDLSDAGAGTRDRECHEQAHGMKPTRLGARGSWWRIPPDRGPR